MNLPSNTLHVLSAVLAALALTGCGGGEVGGTVSGLGSGLSVTLLNNGTDALTVRRNGSFTFATALSADSAYAVSVGTQPVGQTCNVGNGSGTLDADATSVDNVAVSCSFTTSLRGTVSGLQPGVALTLGNGDERVALAADGAFAFARLLADGTRYDVRVLTQPALGSCSVRNGTGTFFAATFTDIVVDCG